MLKTFTKKTCSELANSLGDKICSVIANTNIDYSILSLFSKEFETSFRLLTGLAIAKHKLNEHGKTMTDTWWDDKAASLKLEANKRDDFFWQWTKDNEALEEFILTEEKVVLDISEKIIDIIKDYPDKEDRLLALEVIGYKLLVLADLDNTDMRINIALYLSAILLTNTTLKILK